MTYIDALSLHDFIFAVAVTGGLIALLLGIFLTLWEGK